MINDQTPTDTAPITPAKPVFPTYNPAVQNKTFMSGAIPAKKITTSAVPATTPVASTNPSVAPKLSNPTTVQKTPPTSNESGKDESKDDKRNQKKKLNSKMILGIIVLILVVLGSGAGFYLSQQAQDIRQQASETPIVCSTLLTLENCDAETSTDCAWYFCNDSCHPNGTVLTAAGCDENCDITYCEEGVIPGRLCSQSCSIDKECSNTNADWICDPTSERCRLKGSEKSETCSEEIVAADESTTASDEEIASESATSPTPTPDNSITTLDEEITSESDIDSTPAPNDSTTPDEEVATNEPTNQPELPATLPETGPEDWLNWLKAGLVTLGVGTALFLLL